MIINFFQARDPPMLPALPEKSPANDAGQEDWELLITHLESFHDFGAANKESLGDLLFHFFRRYAHEVDYEKMVVSVRQGKLVAKEEKGWHIGTGNKRLCVEEPFTLTRNLGNSADDTAARGIHLELRRAFSAVAKGDLEELCEQYEFPPEPVRAPREWERPSRSAQKPVLTRSASQNSRVGRTVNNQRPAKPSSNHRNSHSGRRSSNGAFATMPSPMAMRGFPNVEKSQMMPVGLHDQLFQQYQMLQLEQMRLHAHAQAITQSNGGGDNLQASQRHYSQQHATMPAYPGILYHYPLHYEPSQFMTQSQPLQGMPMHHNPGSPSVSHAVPHPRRPLHRDEEGSPNTSARSHSQPARSMAHPRPFSSYAQGNIDMQNLLAYQQQAGSMPLVSTTVYPVNNAPLPSTVPQGLTLPGVSADDNTLKPYVGYWMGQPSQVYPQYQSLFPQQLCLTMSPTKNKGG